MASPRGQNQEGSQMEEEKRSQEEETNFYGEVGDGGGSKLEELGELRPRSRDSGKDLFTKEGREGSESPKDAKEEWGCGRRKAEAAGGNTQRPC